jgi:chitodextrinase
MALALIMALGVIVPVLTIDTEAVGYSGSASYQSGPYYGRLLGVNTNGDQKNDICIIAESQIGHHEGNNSSQLHGTSGGSNNYTEYGRWYGMQDQWCAMFVSWCAAVAGVDGSVVPRHAYTPTGLNFFKNQGRAHSRAEIAAGWYTPQRGDIVYFKSSSSRDSTNHIGIVLSYVNGILYTVEGNTSSSAYSTNGGVVAPHSYNISNTYIVYVCNPAYADYSAPAQPVILPFVLCPDAYKDWVFDASYYAANNPEVAAFVGYDGWDDTALYTHFQAHGVREGRAGSALFDVKYYTEQNPDLAAAFGTDYVAAFNHFISGGSHEPGRKFSFTLDILRGVVFDSGVYFGRYKDVADAIGPHDGALFEHFMLFGIKEGRVASPYFDVGFYYHQNPDLAAAYNTIFGPHYWAAFKHFYTEGLKSQHKASIVVDTIYYTSTSPDLAGMSTFDAVLHYILYGEKEGRRASLEFNADFYYYNNPDIHEAYTYNRAAHHFVAHGVPEGRAGSDDALLTSASAYLGTNFMAKISLAGAGKDLTVQDSGSAVNAVLGTPSNDPAQKWNFIRQADGSYKIKNIRNGYFLTAGFTTNSDAAVTLTQDNGSLDQRWFVYKYKGNLVIRPASKGDLVLDVGGGSTADGAVIGIHRVNYTAAQSFTVTKTR